MTLLEPQNVTHISCLLGQLSLENISSLTQAAQRISTPFHEYDVPFKKSNADRECDGRTHAFDQRGWGRSVQMPSQKGLTGPTTTVLNDISSILKPILATATLMSVPLFLMGHSMGGAEVLQWAARGPPDMRSQMRGYLAESPYLTLHPAAQPGHFTATAGRLAAKVLPKRQMYVLSVSRLPKLDGILAPERFLGVYVVQTSIMAQCTPRIDNTDTEMMN